MYKRQGDIEAVAADIGRYVADRVVERQQFLEGDFDRFNSYYARMTDNGAASSGNDVSKEQKPDLIDEKREVSGSASLVVGITWFILGSVLGLALAFNYHQPILDFLQNI